jgi:predicted methyltransferase
MLGFTLNARQVRPVLNARGNGCATVTTSLDLGLTQTEITLTDRGISLPDGQTLSWHALETIAAAPDACWHIEDNAATPIHAFSPTTQRAYSLLATDAAPTLVNAGFTMHRIKHTDPWQDTLAKIKAASPVRGAVLDTTTGLGYTAIAASRTAAHVTTIELDPTVLEIALLNPWSARLFGHPAITQRVGDAFEVVARLDESSFDLVIHDPPTLSLAGELYSGEFYSRLLRVIRPGGRLFHYIGNPESRQGATVTRGVIRRLHEAGFHLVRHRPGAFGVLAHKPR